MSVFALGYIGFRTDGAIEEWQAFGQDTLGMSGTVESGVLRLRSDDRAFRLQVEKGEPGLAFVGWEVANDEALAEVVRRLEAAGHEVEPASAEDCRARGVREMVRSVDPAGTRLEFFYGQMCPQSPFISPTGTQFVTGDLGLGHVVFQVDRFDETLDFYRRLLGFRVSDIWQGENGTATFLHCNARHHSLALRPGGDPGNPRMIHFMLEVATLDMVGMAQDRGYDALTRRMGRHFNDMMLSCYFRTPSGIEVEYGTGGIQIDDATWTVSLIDRPSGWGHQAP
ncbi:VOC family protein [Maritimibacter sp. UBA3975]|uniref:VOC family protein n=1 Tax=Maritimibacter sp. UBA3975 TaxID=1946833 RepID=UPI0025BFE59E|nr:VOC family protein [Maritimibacter sp. UBA3975]|tara:strand:- start:17619 stop:18464 length:846 start_codon:yes stop_codon:yes gene_type:complete